MWREVPVRARVRGVDGMLVRAASCGGEGCGRGRGWWGEVPVRVRVRAVGEVPVRVKGM